MELLILIIETVWGGTTVGPDYEPASEEVAAQAHLMNFLLTLEILCHFFDEECEGGETVLIVTGVCLAEALVSGDWNKAVRWREPEVSHQTGQNFEITTAQLSALNAGDRLGFWTDRMNMSKDPLGPLAIDIVNNVLMLGCMANQRLLQYAANRSTNVDLDDVGLELAAEHANAAGDDLDGLNGKLDGSKIARYHWDIFADLGLPRQTFGGTPLAGVEAEAEVSKWIWCPSCETEP